MTEAKTAVSEAGLRAEKAKVSASYSYNLSTAEGSVAQETYKAAIKQLQEAVDDAQEAVDTSASLINYYRGADRRGCGLKRIAYRGAEKL